MNKEEKNSKRFTAEDIQRYYAGTMPAAEMHDLEKAALEDPFLADALEGYQYTQQAEEDLAYLKKIIDRRTKVKTVAIPARKPQTPWFSIAALFLLVAGAGWIATQFFPLEKNEQALLKKQMADTAVYSPSETMVADSIQKEEAATIITSADPLSPELKHTERKSIARQKQRVANNSVANRDKPLQGSFDDEEVETQVPAAPMQRAATASISPVNIYKGKVVNTRNEPLPSVSVILSNRAQGVLTDENGQFKIESPDTAITATVSAVGFQTNQLYLNKPNVESKVILKEGSSSLNEVVVTGYGKSKRKSIESAYPLTGWDSLQKYVGTEIAAYKKKSLLCSNQQIRLTFAISKKGRPVNIKTGKGSSTECREEAIRIIREGPSWGGKKGTLTILF